MCLEASKTGLVGWKGTGNPVTFWSSAIRGYKVMNWRRGRDNHANVIDEQMGMMRLDGTLQNKPEEA